MLLPQHGRYAYDPIYRRPAYDWPNVTRLAVTFCNTIEVFAFGSGLGSDHAAGHAPQNQRNFGWRDHGHRVGIWAYLDLMDEYGLKGSHNVNSAAATAYPDIIERIVSRGDEIIAHGRTNAERQDGMWEEDEGRLIDQVTSELRLATGVQPAGWMSPYMAHSRQTLDLLQERGYSYVLDWPADDQPFWLKTRNGHIMSVLYPLEVNDSPAQVFRQHTAREFTDMIVDQFDEMPRRSRKWLLVFGISVHPFIIGQPFRMQAYRRALDHIMARSPELWITAPGEICAFTRTVVTVE